MHTWRERVWASCLVRRRAIKRQLSHYIRQFFWVSAFLQVSYLVSFLLPDLLWDTAPGAHTPLYQEVSQNEGFLRSNLIMAWNYPLTFDSKELFCTCVVSPLSFTQKGFSFCPWHYSLEVFIIDND